MCKVAIRAPGSYPGLLRTLGRVQGADGFSVGHIRSKLLNGLEWTSETRDRQTLEAFGVRGPCFGLPKPCNSPRGGGDDSTRHCQELSLKTAVP